VTDGELDKCANLNSLPKKRRPSATVQATRGGLQDGSCQVIYLGNRTASCWVSKEVAERG
jgi:hypothetical protein